ncbi:hypothetical protein V6N13_066826 [Hibiscus sabdariffa]|uniref:Uncharacterized protein n=1 Tax=Hibiscus sabdariffa TaxID=183260 RepID=A0ABR2DRL2_9ROSI
MEEFTEKERELRTSSITKKQPNTGSKETRLDEVVCRHTFCLWTYEEVSNFTARNCLIIEAAGAVQEGSDPPAFQRAEKERLAKLAIDENTNVSCVIIYLLRDKFFPM